MTIKAAMDTETRIREEAWNVGAVGIVGTVGTVEIVVIEVTKIRWKVVEAVSEAGAGAALGVEAAVATITKTVVVVVVTLATTRTTITIKTTDMEAARINMNKTISQDRMVPTKTTTKKRTTMVRVETSLQKSMSTWTTLCSVKVSPKEKVDGLQACAKKPAKLPSKICSDSNN